MDNALIHAAIVWGALGVALACVVLRLRRPRIPDPAAEPGEQAFSEDPGQTG